MCVVPCLGLYCATRRHTRGAHSCKPVRPPGRPAFYARLWSRASYLWHYVLPASLIISKAAIETYPNAKACPLDEVAVDPVCHITVNFACSPHDPSQVEKSKGPYLWPKQYLQPPPLKNVLQISSRLSWLGHKGTVSRISIRVTVDHGRRRPIRQFSTSNSTTGAMLHIPNIGQVTRNFLRRDRTAHCHQLR